MTEQVYNFGAGPATLPKSVMQQIQEEFLDYKGMGVSLIEISHRSKEFEAVLARCDELVKEIGQLPDNYKILYTHGGAQMQFAAVPLNLLGLKPAHKAVYSETGNFSSIANKEAARYGEIIIQGNGAETDYDRIPTLTRDMIDDDVSYAFVTSNNTIYGTQYKDFPVLGDIPLAVDATSDIFSRRVDFSQLGLAFAGLQKNLGPAGLALVIVRDDLIGHALERTPSLLDYAVYEKNHSLANTNNTFAIYTMTLVLQWLKDLGGVDAIEAINKDKAALIYNALDNSDFYQGTAHIDHRSDMNITFTLPNEELTQKFLKDSLENGLYALKGHRKVGGIRASIYNSMPVEGCQKLVEFMKEFERTQS